MSTSLDASGPENDAVAPQPVREVSAGGVVFRRRGQGIQVVVARQRDRHTGQRTVRLPKGKLVAGEPPEAAAVREVAEETGLMARIVAPLEEVHYRYESRERVSVSKRVCFFLMEYESGEPVPADGEMEEVAWCPIQQALERLTFETERRVLQLAWERLQGSS